MAKTHSAIPMPIGRAGFLVQIVVFLVAQLSLENPHWSFADQFLASSAWIQSLLAGVT